MITVAEKDVVNDANDTAQALCTVLQPSPAEPKPKLSPTAVHGRTNSTTLPDWQHAGMDLIGRQWCRRRIFVEGTDPERFGSDDMKYVNDLVDREAKNSPNHYLETDNGRDALKAIVKRLIREMSEGNIFDTKLIIGTPVGETRGNGKGSSCS
jgi:hypothetical protein